MRLIIDKIEEEYIVAEDEELNMINIPKESIKLELNEGDVILQDDDGNYVLDENSTKNRKEMIADLIKDLWEN